MTRSRKSDRRAAIVILAAILMVASMAMLAFAIDVGYLLLVRTQLQGAADAGAWLEQDRSTASCDPWNWLSSYPPCRSIRPGKNRDGSCKKMRPADAFREPRRN